MHHSLVARAARRALPFVLLATAACGSSTQSSTPSPPGPPSPPTAPGGNTVVGTERIAWEQGLLVPSAQNEYTFAWVVDDVRAGTASATCSAQSATTLSCSAQIPPLTPGTHHLRLM